MSCDRRRADPSTQLDVDVLILDFLCYSATKELLKQAHKTRDSPQADKTLHLAGAFLSLFQTLHGDVPREPELLFRLRLLRFAALFTRRKYLSGVSPASSKLQELRAKRRDNANTFRRTHPGGVDLAASGLAKFPLSQSAIEAIKQEDSSEDMPPARSKNESQAQLPSVSLLDTLPSFIALSAAQIASQECKITEVWMRLAAGYMAQAVVEQYLIYRSQQQNIIRGAFAWGFDENSLAAEGTDEFAINVMFFDDEAEGANGAWESIRDEHLRALMPPEGCSLEEHLRSLLEGELSVADFEERVRAFLEGLQISKPIPILLQVESGSIQGLPAGKVPAMRRSSGLHSDQIT